MSSSSYLPNRHSRSIYVINCSHPQGSQVRILFIMFCDRNTDSLCFFKKNKCEIYYLLSQTKTGWYFSAMGLNFKELEFPGSDTPWIHGFPHLWWSQGSTSQVQQQARQVTTFKNFIKMSSLLSIKLYSTKKLSETFFLIFKSRYKLVAHK